MGAVNGAFNLDVALSALERTGKGRVLSTPRLTTQNNIEAEVAQGIQIPIQVVANNTVTVNFKDAVLTVGQADVRYGLFLNALLAFLLVALAIYLFVVSPMNALEARRQRGQEETPTSKTCSECASEIPVAARRCPMCTQPQHVA